MPKRKKESKEDRWNRKMKEYEQKLKGVKKRRIIYSSDDGEDAETHGHPPATQDIEAEASQYEAAHYDVEANRTELEADRDEVEVNETPPIAPPVTGTALPPQPAADNEIDQDVNFELLLALGECETETIEWGPDIQKDLSTRYQHILQNGLKKQVKEDLQKKYLFPKNTPFSKAPTLNAEISAMLSDVLRNRDKHLQSKQDQIGRALAALTNAMTEMLKKTFDTAKVISILNDCGKLICDSHYAETYTRRGLVLPLVEKSLLDPFKARKRDNFLFGENLGEVVKSSKGIKKTGNMISVGNLNWKGPPSTRQQRPQVRNGGPLAQPRQRQYPMTTSTRRRQPPPLPSQPPRRVPPPPPPTRRAPPAYPVRRQAATSEYQTNRR